MECRRGPDEFLGSDPLSPAEFMGLREAGIISKKRWKTTDPDRDRESCFLVPGRHRASAEAYLLLRLYGGIWEDVVARRARLMRPRGRAGEPSKPGIGGVPTVAQRARSAQYPDWTSGATIPQRRCAPSTSRSVPRQATSTMAGSTWSSAT